jgi:hypothetical protein
MHTVSIGLLVLLVSSVADAYGQTSAGNGAALGSGAEESAPVHQHDPTPGAEHAGQFGSYSMTREASGTAWQPDSSPMSGHHFGSGNWQFMTHGFLNAVYGDESGPRGDTSGFGTGMLGVMGRRGSSSGSVGFRFMLTGEPAMGSNGYPLLLQTGETADGLTPLVDRQHPHDMLMELAGTWSRNLSNGGSLFVYAALAGEPPIGPAAFMHRGSGLDNPLAPIGHHVLDSTHIAHGVVTLGYAARDGVKIEAAVFNGHEPDEERWNIETPRLNSFAGRLTVNPHRDWSLQWSLAHLDEPEQLHRGLGLDVLLMTASTTYNKRFSSSNWQTTVAWGRSKRDTIPLPVLSVATLASAQDADDPLATTHTHAVINTADGSSDTSGQTPIQRGVLVESAANVGSLHTVFSRYERVAKDELFAPADPRHATVYSVARTTLGYVLDLPVMGLVRPGIGLSGSVMTVPSELKSAYGDSPWGLAGFLRLRLGP